MKVKSWWQKEMDKEEKASLVTEAKVPRRP
jgi:hypothetical protein